VHVSVFMPTQMSLIFGRRAFGACNSGKLNQKRFKGKTYGGEIDADGAHWQNRPSTKLDR